MTHKEFKQVLLDTYGINIHVVASNHEATCDLKLFANDIQLSAGETYESFGYFCGGVYNQCAPLDKKEYTDDDIIFAIKAYNDISANEIKYWQRQINYHDIMDLLYTFGDTKVDKAAALRIRGVLKDNFQEMARKKNKKII